VARANHVLTVLALAATGGPLELSWPFWIGGRRLRFCSV
jgi:hypothetical protein